MEPGRQALEHLVIVRRGEDVYQALKTGLEEPGVVRVMWDRREGERRARQERVGVESRRRERRRAPAPTWNTLGFAVVPVEQSSGDRPASG